MVKSAPLAAKKHAIEAEDFLLAPCVPNPINSYKKEKKKERIIAFLSQKMMASDNPACVLPVIRPVLFSLSLFFSHSGRINTVHLLLHMVWIG